MRSVEDMHWHIWEAIRDMGLDMHSKGLIGNALANQIRAVGSSTVRTGKFCHTLRSLACLLEDKLKPYEDQWQRLVDEEDLQRSYN